MKRALASGLIALCLVAMLLWLIAPGTSNDVISVGVVGSFMAVGGLLALRRPENAEGWLLLTVATIWAATALPQAVGEILLARGRHDGLVAWLVWPEVWSWVPFIGILGTQVLLRFPDGRLPSPGWRWFSRFTLTVIVLFTAAAAGSDHLDRRYPTNPVRVESFNQPSRADALIFLLLVACFAGSSASLFIRYRRGSSTERTQIRWITWAAALFVTIYAVALLVSDGWARTDRISILATTAAFAAYALIPVAIGVAILRYRLYEIDRIISRTLSYALVTGVLLAVYAAVVTSVTQLLPGTSSSFSVAAATLAAAALFRPLLSRVQRLVDHRFNRSSYDAHQTVETFAARLRNEVDSDVLSADLLAVLNRAVEPRGVALWVKDVS